MKRTPLKRNQKPLKRTSGLSKGSPKKKPLDESLAMKRMFLEVWDERQDEKGYCYCFETGKKMHRETYRMLSSVYDHVLEKSKYPEYRLVKNNIIIVLPEVHYQKGTNLDFVPKINAHREHLLTLHKNGELKD